MTQRPDRYHYFRIEAHELLEGMRQGAAALAEGAPAMERLPALLRQAHTLKGAARVVGLEAIAACAHRIEELLLPFRSLAGALPAAASEALSGCLQEARAHLEALTRDGEDQTRVVKRADSPAEFELATMRVELSALDALLEDLSEAAVQIDALGALTNRIERLEWLAETLGQALGSERDPRSAAPLANELQGGLRELGHRLRGGLARAESELDQMRQRADQLRMAPTRDLFAALEQTAIDAAAQLGKRVRLETAGELRLESPLLARLRGALIHAVRNAVDHGIETPAERLAAGKGPQGLITVKLERRGGHLLVSCQDDGRGIDAARVQASAVRAGLVAPERALSADEALELVFQPGLSTAGSVSAISGRGIGLDAIRAIAAALDARLTLVSRPGEGTRLELLAPLALSATRVLLLGAAGQRLALPLDSVEQTLRLADARVASAGTTLRLVRADESLPYMPLSSLWPGHRDESAIAVIVEAQGKRAVLGVERLEQATELLMRPLPAALGAQPLVAGAALDSEGMPLIVLDPGALVAAVEQGAPAPAPTAAARRRPILVVDDSLTTRMLEQAILEAAGYPVMLAANAEDGLKLAREGDFGLFIVDVEMPGMDGFAFVRAVRADEDLKRIPAVMLSSLSAPEYQARGREVGAQAYLVKAAFDQERFLKLVEELTV
ncbi:MAG TPA: response regulator [Oscillatoriaceae cyanobacterium]